MKKYFIFLLTNFFAFFIFTANSTSVNAANLAENNFFTVAKYNPTRDPAEDLKMTITKATKEKKKIILHLGGEWCGWCHLLTNYMLTNKAISKKLNQSYLVMKVNFSQENKNETFLKQFPPARGYPYLYVLDSDGSFLHAQETGSLEKGKGYNQSKVLGFLNRWSSS